MTRPRRWVVDTNVLVSAFLWQGTPGRVIELAAESQIQVFTSTDLLDELLATLSKPKLARHVANAGSSASRMHADFRRLASLVAPRNLARRVSRDVDDDAVLACAIAAGADLIVTGDDDLLSIDTFEDIPIVTAAIAIQRF